MPEQTEHRDPLDLTPIRRRFDRFRRYENAAGGPLTGEEHVNAIAAAWDVEPLLAEITELRERVAAAEKVCVIHGGLPPVDASQRGKAALQAWMDWSHSYHRFAAPVSRAEEGELARRRDEIRAVTLARIRAEYGGDPTDRAAAGGGAGNPAMEYQPPPTPTETEG